jgi:hypothetical protein
MNEIGGACSMYGRQEKCYRVLVGRYERKKPFGIPRFRWEDTIIIVLQEVG